MNHYSIKNTHVTGFVNARETFIEGIGGHRMTIQDAVQRTVVIGEGSACAVLTSVINMMKIAALSKGFQVGIGSSQHTGTVAANLDFGLVLKNTVNIIY